MRSTKYFQRFYACHQDGARRPIIEAISVARSVRSAQSQRASRSVGMADHHERLNQAFDAIDADRSGEITPAELIDHMLGMQMEHETVSALFSKMDTDGNYGSISRAEFLAGFDRLMAEWAQPGPAVGSQEEAAAAAATFAAVDADNSGKLDLEELLSALAAAGDVADRAEVEALFKRLDVNGDGEP